MADLKTEQGITAELKKQEALLRDIDGRTKAGLKLKEKILQLEEKLTKIKNTISVDEKSINAEITKRIKKVRELSTQESASAKLQSAALQAQNQALQLIKGQVSAGIQLRGTLKEQKDTVLALGTGMNDIAGVQNLQAQSALRMDKLSVREAKFQDLSQKAMEKGKTAQAERFKSKAAELSKQQDIEESLKENLKVELESLRAKDTQAAKMKVADKLTGGLASKAMNFAKSIATNPSAAGFTVVAAIIAGIIKMVTAFNAKVDAVGKSFGFMATRNKEFASDLMQAGVDVTGIGKSLTDVMPVVSQLSSEFGIGLQEATDISAKVLDTGIALGIADSEAAKLFGTFMQIGGLTGKQAEDLIESTGQLAAQEGVAPVAVLNDLAQNAELTARWFKDGGTNLAAAAINAKKLGLNLDTIAQSARGVLNFEESITAEIEASVFTGKQLNLQKARELSLNKDLVGFEKEIVKQIKAQGDFIKMGVFEQEALAKAVGMTVGQVSKLVSGTKELTTAGALAGKSFDDIAGQESLGKLTKIINSFKELGAQVLQSFGEPLYNALDRFKLFLEDEKKVEALKKQIKDIASTFVEFAKGIASIMKLLAPIFKAAIFLNPTMQMASLTSRANGGPVNAGSPYVVGDGPSNQPELFIPKTAGHILPQVPSMADGNAFIQGDMKETNELLRGILGATSNEKTIVTDSQVKRISYTGGLAGELNPYG